MMRRLVVLCIVSGAAAVGTGRRGEAGAWNYDRCDGSNGPALWPGLAHSAWCDAAEQSPINLCGATESADARNLSFAAGYGRTQTYKFSADGKAYIDASAGADLTLDAGSLV